ncbi:YccF domain-containing protein [Arcanobacterium phocae]|uniref:YccF domain-containing protein n=1 Tax=Arcanobacterium phocae TaxID=131112 RepID=UPI001E52233B|nr:YccF domain-containing protein [Arcanobacterium phocae]
MVGNTISDAPKRTTYSLRLFKVFRLGQKPYATAASQTMWEPLLKLFLWLVFGGIEMFFVYLIACTIGLIFIVTIPMSLAIFRIAGYLLWPFGRTVVQKPNSGIGSTLMNIIWFIIAGFWLAIGHLLSAAILTTQHEPHRLNSFTLQ